MKAVATHVTLTDQPVTEQLLAEIRFSWCRCRTEAWTAFAALAGALCLALAARCWHPVAFASLYNTALVLLAAGAGTAAVALVRAQSVLAGLRPRTKRQAEQVARAAALPVVAAYLQQVKLLGRMLTQDEARAIIGYQTARYLAAAPVLSAAGADLVHGARRNATRQTGLPPGCHSPRRAGRIVESAGRAR